MSKFLTFKSIIIILFAVVFGNLLVVNFFLIQNINSSQEKETKTTKASIQTTQQNVTSSECNLDCQEKIKNQVLLDLSSNETTQETNTSNSSNPIGPTNLQKEYFIALGAGSSSSTNWELVPGAQAVIDGSAYVSIEHVNFQASLHTPTGNQIAWARLYNVTDNLPVPNSEVSISGGESKLLISDFISLANSPKTYQVQMKTQTGHITNLIQSRIYIKTH